MNAMSRDREASNVPEILFEVKTANINVSGHTRRESISQNTDLSNFQDTYHGSCTRGRSQMTSLALALHCPL